MLPVMIGATVEALRGGVLLPYLLWGSPAAVLVALAWTRFRLGTIPAEICVRSDQAALRSVNDCLRGYPPDWGRVLDLRENSEGLSVAIGWNTYMLRPGAWPNYHALRDALEHARHPTQAASDAPSSAQPSPSATPLAGSSASPGCGGPSRSGRSG
jgi:hypothetical protein